MNILDIIIILCFLVALVQGIRNGFIAQIISIISIIAGIWLSFKFANVTARYIGEYIEAGEPVLRIIAFTVILVLVILGFGVLGKLLEATIKIVLLGWLNKLLGAIFAIMKYALVIGLCFMAFDSINKSFHIIQEKTLSESKFYSPLKNSANTVFPYLKGLTKFNN